MGRKNAPLTLTFLLLIFSFNVYSQSFNGDDKDGLRFFLRQSSSVVGKLNIECLGLNVTDTLNWDSSENWLIQLQNPLALTYIDWEWDMAEKSRLVRFEIKTFDDSNSQLAGILDCSKFAELTTLNCSNSNLSRLDISDNFKLRSLDCSGNKLTSLDTRQASLLNKINCSDNLLSDLDVSSNYSLSSLNCSNNQLLYLDLSNNLNMSGLLCSDNSLDKMMLPKSNFLESLDCSNNNLLSLDVSGYTLLKSLSCFNNKIETIDLSANSQLVSVYLNDNKFVETDLSSTNKLLLLNVSKNNFTNLGISGIDSLVYLYCADNGLNNIDVSSSSYLEVLKCNNNDLTSLDLTNNLNISDLNCAFNAIDNITLPPSVTSLFVSLVCNDNSLTFRTIPFGSVTTDTHVFTYSPQNEIDGGEQFHNKEINLSDIYNVGGYTSIFNWVDENGVGGLITDNGNGIFSATLNENRSYFCKITNEKLPLLTLNYKVKILKDVNSGVDNDESDNLILIQYDKPTGTLSFSNPDLIKSVNIYDTLGRRFAQAVSPAISSGISVQDASKGVYLIHIELLSGKSMTQKVYF